MRLRFRGADVQFPLSVIKGRLRLSGLVDNQAADILQDAVIKLKATVNPSKEILLNLVRKSLESNKAFVRENFETLTKYENLREESHEIPPIVVILEGASATGKSVIASELVHNLVATRFINSDTVRQVLRSTMNEEEYPEIYCHTYQAHLHRQTGSENLDTIVRGYLAQCAIITPQVTSMTERLLSEGATGVVEGVHILPGMLHHLSPGVIEVLINPDDATHKIMFTSKHSAEKLRTVSEDIETREREYECTRAIQDYMVSLAQDSNIPIVDMMSFEEATRDISEIIVGSVRKLVADFEGAS
jgi:2-phosphoglycerate kinase